MAVYVIMTVRPPDPQKFETASREMGLPGRADGAWGQFWGHKENDPATYIYGGYGDSHEAMHRYTDRVGDEFNRRAGTEGVEWETSIWQVTGSTE